MKFLTRCVSVLALIGLMPLSPILAQQRGVGPWHPVKDDIKFFSVPAKERADAQIADLKKTYNKDLYIEAIPAPKRPADVKADDKAAVNKFFDEYSEKRFANLHINGVYIMIIDDPHVLRVVVGNHTQQEGYFTLTNRDVLNEKVVDKLKRKDHDGALATATSYIVDTMKANHPIVSRKGAQIPVVEPGHAAPRSAGFQWGGLLTILAIIVVVWIVFAVIRGLFANRSGYGGGPGMGYGGAPGYGGGGGGGFFSNFLGGMFGAAAGMWMYNSFFGGHSGSSAWAAGPSEASDKTYPDSGPADTSGSATGGDYGPDNAGSGDWGGADSGDAGGGDAGGGDWGGGGGGDWGGGGGDFGGGGGDWGGGGGGGGDW